MDDALQCSNCGIWVHCFIRKCPICGKSIFTSLDITNARPERFFDLMTSLYNLVADRENPQRNLYIPSFSEEIILRKCGMDFQDEMHAVFLKCESEYEWPEEIRDLYAMCLSYTLCGYVFRTVEELVSQGKSHELSTETVNRIISSLVSRKEIFEKSSYKLLDWQNELDSRILFCLAMLMNGTHLECRLVDPEQHEAWSSCIIEQSTSRAVEFFEIAFGALRPDKSIPELVLEWHDFIRDNVERGFLFGYAVKLSESLIPYKLRALSGVH